MNHSERVERAENVADIRRGKAILDSGERITFNELSDGDFILGVGTVENLMRHAVGRVSFNVVGDDSDHFLNMRAENFITIRKRS